MVVVRFYSSTSITVLRAAVRLVVVDLGQNSTSITVVVD